LEYIKIINFFIESTHLKNTKNRNPAFSGQTAKKARLRDLFRQNRLLPRRRCARSNLQKNLAVQGFRGLPILPVPQGGAKNRPET